MPNDTFIFTICCSSVWKKNLFIILPVPNSFCLLWQNTKNAVAEPFVPDPSNKIFFAPAAGAQL